MEFCPKCGSVLISKIKNSGCTRCGYVKKGQVDLSTKETVKDRSEISVFKNNAGSTNPMVEEKCPECSHKRAYFWTMQTRGSDESETKFFKCVKCNHTWRDYR